MLSTDVCLLLVTCCLSAATLTLAIRVEWGTNKGPIVPPTPRPQVRPLPPYREPAPVWEDQHDDIPNPNPYVYVLPPPSRPRTWPIPYAENDNYNNKNRNYGILTTQPQKSAAGTTQIVAALAPKYVPNVGWHYVAVIQNTAAAAGNQFGAADKLQGKYNAKTKKYKVYEKVKYAPLNYYRPPKAQSLVPEADFKQHLPLAGKPPVFNAKVGKQTDSVTSTKKPPTTTVKIDTEAISKKNVSEKAKREERSDAKKLIQQTSKSLFSTNTS